MKASSNAFALIESFEGFRANAYRDAGRGVWTIGYGTTSGVKRGDTITREGASARLRRDCGRIERVLSTAVKVLTQNQFDACVSLAYNIGAGAFSNSTLLRKLNAGDTQGAAAEFLRWNRAGGKILNGLTRRRVAERELFLNP